MVHIWVQLKRCCVTKRHSGDGCDLVLTLCKYDFRKRDLFVLNWARVQQMTWGSISSELVMCGGCVCSILLLPLVARYMLLLLFATTRSVFKSVKVSVVEIAKRTN